MAKKLQLRRGTTTEHIAFIGAVGEVTVDTTKDTVVVHDGITAGGHPLAKASDLELGVTTLVELTDTVIAAPADGEVLAYDSTTNKWINTTTADVSIAWGDITGTLSNQSDLQSALNSKLSDTSHSFATNGYQKLSNGLIIQWGTSSGTSGTTNRVIAFPIAFPNACFAVTANSQKNDGNLTYAGGMGTITTTTFNMYNAFNSSDNYSWIAIGY